MPSVFLRNNDDERVYSLAFGLQVWLFFGSAIRLCDDEPCCNHLFTTVGGDDNRQGLLYSRTGCGVQCKWQSAKQCLCALDMTISIVKNVPSSISSVEAEANAPVEYFTLDGKRVNNISAKGLYIKRQGGKAVKVVVVE